MSMGFILKVIWVWEKLEGTYDLSAAMFFAQKWVKVASGSLTMKFIQASMPDPGDPASGPLNRTQLFRFHIHFHRKAPTLDIGAPPNGKSWICHWHIQAFHSEWIRRWMVFSSLMFIFTKCELFTRNYQYSIVGDVVFAIAIFHCERTGSYKQKNNIRIHQTWAVYWIKRIFIFASSANNTKVV